VSVRALLSAALLSAAALVAATALGQPAALAAPRHPATDPQPPDAACWYNNVNVVKQFPPAALAEVPWPQKRLGYEQAHRYTVGDGIRVAVIDSGVQAAAPQLAGHVSTGFDVTSGTPRPGGNTDCFTHGTGVAGIIAAHHRDGIGFVGVAPGVQILPIRETWGIDRNGQIITDSPTKLVDAINLAVQNRVQVINISITVDGDLLSAPLRQAFRAAVENAAAHDVVIVAASGNSEEQRDRLQVHNSYPAALAGEFDNVIAVGGLEPDGTLYKQSVYGESPYITVVAPADGVVSTFIEKGQVGSALQYREGTSFATPFVTGTVALMRARFPDMHAAQIKRRIEQTADHPSTNLPSLQFGYGVVDPVAALTAAVPSASATRPAPQISAPLPPPPGPDVRTRDIALAVGVGATLVALALAVAAVVLPRGRRRRWQPGRRTDLPTPTA
jgi:type VII secretion-associated serine protease mycosin